jgi:hypothetical protein
MRPGRQHGEKRDNQDDQDDCAEGHGSLPEPWTGLEQAVGRNQRLITNGVPAFSLISLWFLEKTPVSQKRYGALQQNALDILCGAA